MKATMVRGTLDTALTAIKMVSWGNAGAAVGVFTHAAFVQFNFIWSAFLFALGFTFSVLCAGVAYLTQWQYGIATMSFEDGDIEKCAQFNRSGHRRRKRALYLWWLSLASFAAGVLFVLYKCLYR